MRRRRRAAATGTVELIGADIDQRLRVPVVRVVDDDHVLRIRVRAGETQREIVRLAARVHEIAHGQRIGQRGRQPFGVLDDPPVEVPSVRVERADLLLCRGDDARMTVADVADVVHAIKISPAIGIEEILAVAARDLER